MVVGLAVPSFVCAAFLAVFIPVQRIRTSVPRLAIVLFLFGYNLVHGVNTLVWSGNVDIHIPVWCDIVTNFMLGTNLAVPAALFCIARQLEHLSSTRTLSSHPTIVRNHLILDIFMCYLLPIIYILLHLVVQNHRFDITEGIGCSASIDPSAIALSLMWIPPLLICGISIILFALSIHNCSRHSSAHLAEYIGSRSAMTSSSFFRCLVVSMGTTITAGLVYIFCSFSGPALHPWSWAANPESMSKVNIVSSKSEVTSIQVAWWGGFVISIMYLVLSFCLGEETRDIFQWIRKQATRERHFVLPIRIPKKAPTSPLPSSLPERNRPLSIEFKSGWDDKLNVKIPKTKKHHGTLSPTTISTCSSPTPTISTVATGDDVFMASTLSYLRSPAAKTLGLPASPVSPTALKMPHKPKIPVPVSPTFPKLTDWPSPPNSPLPNLPRSSYVSSSRSPVSPTAFEMPHKPKIPVPLSPTVPKATDNVVTSPPNSPLPSLPASSHVSRSHSLATMYSEETFGHTRPFAGSSVSSQHDNCSTGNPTVSPTKSILKRPSLRSLQRSWNRENLGDDPAPSAVIHMTVVKETV